MAPTKTPESQPTSNPAPSEPTQSSPETGTKKTSGLAVAALVLAFFFPLIGLILGIVALSSIKKNKEGGHGLAVAAIIISAAIMILSLLAVIGFAVAINKAAKDSGVNVSNGSVTVQGKDGGSASFGDNVSLPSGFPSDVPIYKPSEIKGSLKTGKDAYSVTLLTDDSFSQVDSYYKSELAKQGWKSGENNGEFSSGSGKLATYSKGNQTLGILIATGTGSNKQTSVTLTVGPNSSSSNE